MNQSTGDVIERDINTLRIVHKFRLVNDWKKLFGLMKVEFDDEDS